MVPSGPHHHGQRVCRGRGPGLVDQRVWGGRGPGVVYLRPLPRPQGQHRGVGGGRLAVRGVGDPLEAGGEVGGRGEVAGVVPSAASLNRQEGLHHGVGVGPGARGGAARTPLGLLRRGRGLFAAGVFILFFFNPARFTTIHTQGHLLDTLG